MRVFVREFNDSSDIWLFDCDVLGGIMLASNRPDGKWRIGRRLRDKLDKSHVKIIEKWCAESEHQEIDLVGAYVLGLGK